MIQLSEDTILWRYINLEKFESLLKEKALFFCRADKFSDPFEGSVPKREAEFRDKKKNYISDTHKHLKMFVVINCWQINNSESDAMWRIYLKTNEGVAIQTTVKKLTESFINSPLNLYLSKIRYINFNKDIWYHHIDYPHSTYNLYTPFVHKRVEFKHEQECRVLHEINSSNQLPTYWDFQNNNIGHFIQVDANNLIERVILSPTSDENVRLKVENLLTKYSLNKQIDKSKLNDKPIY